MLKNYFKLAWRSLFKNKLYSVIILSGLALAYTACILIYLHVSDELSYDRYHENGDRIYRVVKDFVNDDGTFLPDATTPPALAPAILKEIPEVEEAVRLMPGWGNKYLVRRGDKTFFEELRYRGDSAVLKVFTFTFLEGNPDKALSKPENVIISKKMADKYFGHESPIGKNIEIGEGDSKLKVVTAVISDIPDNSHFHFDFLMAMPSQSVEWSSDWGWYNWYTYIKLKSGANIKDVETKIVTLFKKNNPESKTRYYTQALSDIHLNSKLKWELEPNGDATFVKIFIIVGIFIILIAAVNYINLSIAQGLSRSKEVGIRKVSGAFGVRLITQFLAESVLISMLAAIVAIALVELVLPSLNDQFQKNILPVSRQPFEILAGIMALAFLLGTISGFYPSLYLSAFKPVQVLKGAFQTGNRSLWLRKGLVIVQFTISIALITGTILVVRQVNYLRSKDLGFDKDHVVVVQNAQYVQQKVAMKHALAQVPNAGLVGSSNGILGGQNWTTGMAAKGSTGSSLINFTVVDYDYIPAMDLKIIQGRNFSREFPSDTLRTVIINETALKDLGITGDPIGALITDDPEADTIPYYTIIGVIKDFHFANLHNEIKPYLFLLDEDNANNFVVKINTTAVQGTLNGLKSAWQTVQPDRPFEYFFLDETFDKLYKAEENFKVIFSALTGLAIYIACSGLFAVASFFIKRRTKEIGIRKVLGASVPQITWMVSVEFLVIVLLANIVAWPLAYQFMDSWLNGFAYRINLDWNSFVLAGVIALLIAAITVSFHSIRSAMANPVDSLRNE